MDKYNFIKFSTAIFILLSVIISLFPPFEFGNEKKRTLSERRNNSKIVDKLPIKKYDFIFNDNKKYFALDSTIFNKIFPKDSVEPYKEKWSDKKFQFVSSIDSFFTAKGFLFPTLLNERYKNGKRKINNKLNYKEYGLVDLRYSLDRLPTNYVINYDEVFKHPALSPQEEWKFNQTGKLINDEMKKNDPLVEDADFIKEAINYWDVKREYEKEPFNWNWGVFFHFDSAGNYEKYNITQPEYYSLERKILLSEFFIEYILAFFVSIIFGYLIQKIKSRKPDKS